MRKANTDQLKTFLKGMTLSERKAFASSCSTTVGNLNQIIYVNKKCSAALAIRIDKASGGIVMCDDLCPDADFEYIREKAASA
ncbi:hypothetical protein [Acinetobacter towneri]|uniref:hypothetical protein n=1 Tax=Acinetobacter towneri TaxID=202956 RepID=UPI003989B1CE